MKFPNFSLTFLVFKISLTNLQNSPTFPRPWRKIKFAWLFPDQWPPCEWQILKKWKWPYLLNWVEYIDKLLRKHWYWQDLAQEIANWHFLSVEALPSSKFWKSENGPISWTVKNIVMKFCIHIDNDKIKPMRLSNAIWDWSRFCWGSNSEKKWNWPHLLNLLVYLIKFLHTHAWSR